ncbi:ALP1-like protein [Tanacetum coccineum]|uniref:ALP1-like protein n=1 Tax=Tanacetum coccineum TaxID=301880 RepID=A0ABQ5EVD0_9ASTR
MLGSVDCMHWECINCLKSWHEQIGKGDKTYSTIMLEVVASYDLWIWHAFLGVAGVNNDLTILNNYPLFDNLLNDIAPIASFEVNGVRNLSVLIPIKLLFFYYQWLSESGYFKFCGLIAVVSLTNLAQLPESNAILVLDQFMLSGAEERDKRAYLTSLISKALQGGQTRIRSTTFGYVKIKRVHDSGLFTADYSFALSIVFVLSVFRWKHLTGFIDLLDSGGRKVTGLDTKYTDTSMLLLSLSLTWKVLASFSRPLAVIRTVLYVLSFSLGAGPVHALLLPEIFASRIIAKAVALSLYIHWVR